MKTWNRGRKPATPEQKVKAKEWQKSRVKITNMVARDDTIEKKCCICGKEDAQILHNKINPYNIAFICSECRKNNENKKKAENYRIDLEKYKENKLENRKGNRYLDTRKFTKKEVKEIVDGYIKEDNKLTIGKYVEEHKLSRYQFKKLIILYSKYFNNEDIDKIALNKTKAINRELRSKKNK